MTTWIFDDEVSGFIDQKIVGDAICFDNFKYLNKERKKSAEIDRIYLVLLHAKLGSFSHCSACIIVQL